MATKNYKSDFNFILHLYSVLTDSAGKEKERTELPWPDYDWSAKFWTSSKANAYYASCIGGVCTNCRNTDGKIQIVVDNHNMGLGTLQVEFRAELPREIYPDGSERNVVPGVLDIELVRGAGDFPSDFEAQLQMPYIKLKYEDLTEEEKAEFQRPVTDATESLQKFQTTAEEAEVKREANEKTRVSAEQTRVAKETERQTKEATRQSQEAQRIAAEADREEAETSRVSAEEKRAEEFATWETEIDSKADRSELSNVIAEKSDDGAILKERGTGEALYPRTHASLIMTSSGASVDEALEGKAEKEEVYKVFDDAWTADGGTVVESGVSYGLNELTLTLAEAIEVEKHAIRDQYNFYARLRNVKIRTNIVLFQSSQYMPLDLGSFAQNCGAEVLRLAPGEGKAWVKSSGEAFRRCVNLKTILNVLVDRNDGSTWQWWYLAFKDCPLLETVKIEGLKGPVSFGDSPRLTLESLSYTVEHVNTEVSGIVITVHADVYAKLTGDTTNAAAAALTEEELAQWQQVLADAVAKNISFATT